ncbi:MAG: hypothetical protein ETSY2_43585 [Candidatus Entotheonella gemina]|uniref:DUF4258 domain-containing protein n=1 Tax=Candidatus Entotheonella gemina TaxID=1429439 RepID=W4LKS9_9BACT|nr:MAG: hypothetical protein ETSY2_43585 [Candidatus Entotheonella gemina]
MYDRILARIQEHIRQGEYILTDHVRDEMDEDDFTLYDLEQGILSGNILERQRDRVTREAKYRIRGTATDDREMEIIVKFNFNRRLVIITVYEL